VAKLETEHIFTGNIQSVYDGLREFNKYPEYLPGVTGIKLLPPKVKNSSCQVRYELRIIKEFYYVLNMYEESPTKIWWDMDESNIMKSNVGSWKLKEKGEGSTRAIYTLDIQLKGLIPRAITDRVAEANLPAMLAGFQRLIDDCRKS
jgi:ribosome-associated toxin RatA of RatAB toxin-antitoxin module